jgi:hypothetical protein
MDCRLVVNVAQMKGVVARKRILEINGAHQHELQPGPNELAVADGTYQFNAYIRAPIGTKVCATKPLTVTLAPGQTVELVYHMVGGRLNREFRLEVKGQEAPPPAPLPAWVWVFVVACAAIPVVSLGGAVPAVLGVLGAGGCVSTAKAKGLPLVARLGICLAITVACWIGFIVLISSIVRARS